MDNKVGIPNDRENSSAESLYEQPILQTQAPETDNTPSSKPTIPRAFFPNRLRSNKNSKYLDKILEIFK